MLAVEFLYFCQPKLDLCFGLLCDGQKLTCLELIRAYRLLVIGMATGPRAKDIEIILPVRLATPLARIRFLGNAFASWACNTVIFSSGTDTIPKFKVNVKA